MLEEMTPGPEGRSGAAPDTGAISTGDATAAATGRAEGRRDRSRAGRGAILALLFAMHLLDSVDRWLLASVLRQVSQELDIDESEAGWLSTVLLLAFAFSCPLVGYWPIGCAGLDCSRWDSQSGAWRQSPRGSLPR